MKTSWDVLVAKEQSKLKLYLARLSGVRESIRIALQSKETLTSQVTEHTTRLNAGVSLRIDEWELTKTFLSDLNSLISRCEEQEQSLRAEERNISKQIARTNQKVRKYEWLQTESLKKYGRKQARMESEMIDEWLTNSAAD